MRMWMVPAEMLCRTHLLGEHGELHKFLPSWRKKYSIAGRVAGNAMEPRSYKRRHDELAAEMLRRGYKHSSPLEQPDFSYLPAEHREFSIDVEASLRLLIKRCPECAKRAKECVSAC